MITVREHGQCELITSEYEHGFFVYRPSGLGLLLRASNAEHIFGTTCLIFTNIFLLVTYGRGSVLVWRRSDKLYTSGFTDDVMFAHKPRLLDVAAQLKRSAHAALSLAINCAQ